LAATTLWKTGGTGLGWELLSAVVVLDVTIGVVTVVILVDVVERGAVVATADVELVPPELDEEPEVPGPVPVGQTMTVAAATRNKIDAAVAAVPHREKACLGPIANDPYGSE
jgi:hypothetical protein